MREQSGVEIKEKVIHINRVAKVVKGGKRFSFSVIVVVGDGKGGVGFSVGKANEIPDAIKKAIERAKKHMIRFPVHDGTIPHEIIGRFGASSLVLRPAGKGTGIIAGSVVRSVMELSGVKNILTKSLYSNNPHNLLKATLAALEKLEGQESRFKKRGISEAVNK
ncbi:MAG TPA: 30S ribosomal protein S5 [bacterium]